MARKWRETGSLDTKVTEEIDNNTFITAVESRNLTNFPPLYTPLPRRHKKAALHKGNNWQHILVMTGNIT
jgi:hypothetical protein